MGIDWMYCVYTHLCIVWKVKDMNKEKYIYLLSINILRNYNAWWVPHYLKMATVVAKAICWYSPLD